MPKPKKRSVRPAKPKTRPRVPAPTPPPGTTSLVLRGPADLLSRSGVPPNLPEGSALTLPEQPVISLAGLSQSDLTREDGAALMADFTNDEVDIKPTGEAYIAHIHLRKRLSMILGTGAWGLQPMGKPVVHAGTWMVMAWALFIRGLALSWTWGGARYQENNPRASWSDALETTKSDALSRLCKDIPMGGQCWDRRHNARFRRETCVLVYVEVWKDGKSRTETQWRTLDRDPFPGEKGVHPESPNADKYKPPAAARALAEPFIDAEVSPVRGTATTGAPQGGISEGRAKRLLAIAKEVGWTKPEVVRYLKETCKLKPAPGKPDDLWHLSLAVQTRDYDRIVSEIQLGKQ